MFELTTQSSGDAYQIEALPVDYLWDLPIPVTITFAKLTGPGRWVYSGSGERLKKLRSQDVRPYSLADWAACISWGWTAADYEKYKPRPKGRNPSAPSPVSEVWSKWTGKWTRYPPTVGQFLKETNQRIEKVELEL